MIGEPNRKAGALRASLWLVLALLVFVSPAFSTTDHRLKRDDARQPAAQSTIGISLIAARPTGLDGAPVAIPAEEPTLRSFWFQCTFVAREYHCQRLIKAASFNPRAPPLAQFITAIVIPARDYRELVRTVARTSR